MANQLLKPVFKEVFDRDFDPHKFSDRLEMQKTIYLLYNMGISVGNYSFLWYKHGPYSQTLQNDILNLEAFEHENVIVVFSEDAVRVINMLKKAIFEKEYNYTQEQWLECLGSLYYIKYNQLSFAASDDKIIEVLEEKKPYLNNHDDNIKALKTIDELFN